MRKLECSASPFIACVGRRALPLALSACAAFAAAGASAQLAPNQTQGFGNDRLVTFTYQQNFDCVDEPLLDLDFNGIAAQSDPNEMQTPICQVITEPSADPAGGDIRHTAHLYVLVPMFGSDTNAADAMPCPNGGRPDELCGPALGNALISAVRLRARSMEDHARGGDAMPRSEQSGARNVHDACVVRRPVRAVGGARQDRPRRRPRRSSCRRPITVTSSTIHASMQAPIWWQVRPVLVMDPRDWPAADGSSGITSSKAMDAAEAAGRAVEVGSNFFLFFSSKMSAMNHAMHH